MTKNLLIILTLLLIPITVSAHKDFWVSKRYGNVTSRIKTGYGYEEIRKVQIIGKLAEQLALKSDYTEPILLDFDHAYTGNSNSTYYLGVDDQEITYNHGANEQKILIKKKIVIYQIGSSFNIINTLKMLEYSIKNRTKIEVEQKPIKRWKRTINSIDKNKTIDILKSPETELINSIKNTKIYRPEKDFKSGFTYFWKNDRYNIVFVEESNEKTITTSTNIYDFEKRDNIVFVFKTPSKLIVHETSKKEIISKKYRIRNASKNYKPYKISKIGDNMYTISFSYYYRRRRKKQILIFDQTKGRLIRGRNKYL